METSTIISTAITLHDITDLNIYVFDQDQQFFYRHELFELPVFMQEKHETLIAKLAFIQEDQVYILNNEWELQFLGYSIKVKDIRMYILLGPYYEKAPDFFKLTREHRLNRNQSEVMRGAAKNIAILTGEKINSYASVLQQFQNLMENNKTSKILISSHKKEQDVSKIKYEEIDEEDVVELRYRIERNFLRAVEKGDKQQALQLINSSNPLFSFSERLPNQPIRRVKNNLIVLNTLLRTAARNSLVPVIMVHRISKDYARKIEQVGQLGVLYQIEDQMIGDYCDLVQSNSLKNYSIMIQKLIEKITTQYNQPLSFERLAEQFNIHVSHLSRMFKQETGYTIKGYQQMLRLNEAKYLLETEKLTIEDISWMVGYDDPSYFTRVFKKEIGKTPTQFRKQ